MLFGWIFLFRSYVTQICSVLQQDQTFFKEIVPQDLAGHTVARIVTRSLCLARCFYCFYCSRVKHSLKRESPRIEQDLTRTLTRSLRLVRCFYCTSEGSNFLFQWRSSAGCKIKASNLDPVSSTSASN